MNKLYVYVIMCTCALLGACAKSSTPPPTTTTNHDAYVALAEAAGSVSQSLTQLGATEQAAYPPVSVATPPNPASYGMALPTSVNWNGPIEPLVRQIANATNYKLNVLGKAPSIPIILSISAKNVPMGNILRDAGYQAGKRANVVVFPDARVIELRYKS